MDKNKYQKYENLLYESIPVIKEMDISILELGIGHVSLIAPLNKNFNYEGSAFGGSLSTINTVAGYLLTRYILEENQLDYKSLVIKSGKIDYLSPVRENFVATATANTAAINTFLRGLKRKKLARLWVDARVYSDKKAKQQQTQNHALVSFTGEYVANL